LFWKVESTIGYCCFMNFPLRSLWNLDELILDLIIYLSLSLVDQEVPLMINFQTLTCLGLNMCLIIWKTLYICQILVAINHCTIKLITSQCFISQLQGSHYIAAKLPLSSSTLKFFWNSLLHNLQRFGKDV